MISVKDAENIIQSNVKDFGVESVSFENSLGRVLAEDLFSDRELPPFNRATLDGIAIKYDSFEKGIRSFHIKLTLAAGDTPVDIDTVDECVEIMTGAALPDSTDTVIGYEDLNIDNGNAFVIKEWVTKRQGVHEKGKDRSESEMITEKSRIITPALISVAASIGKSVLLVKKLPKVVVISSGNELVPVDEKPSPFQIRRSNGYTIAAALKTFKIDANMVHIPDDPEITRQKIRECLQNFDVVILTGGISMGKFDYIPKALEALSVHKLFHKVQQRPGKPFWFGVANNGVAVFALPGNPVSTFMCLYRYVIPWLKTSLDADVNNNKYAVLNKDFSFMQPLQYFLQVKLHLSNEGQLLAEPVEGNGSGDFANLQDTDAFMELPLEQNNFTKGEVYRIWPFA